MLSKLATPMRTFAICAVIPGTMVDVKLLRRASMVGSMLAELSTTSITSASRMRV